MEWLPVVTRCKHALQNYVHSRLLWNSSASPSDSFNCTAKTIYQQELIAKFKLHSKNYLSTRTNADLFLMSMESVTTVFIAMCSSRQHSQQRNQQQTTVNQINHYSSFPCTFRCSTLPIYLIDSVIYYPFTCDHFCLDQHVVMKIVLLCNYDQ